MINTILEELTVQILPQLYGHDLDWIPKSILQNETHESHLCGRNRVWSPSLFFLCNPAFYLSLHSFIHIYNYVSLPCNSLNFLLRSESDTHGTGRVWKKIPKIQLSYAVFKEFNVLFPAVFKLQNLRNLLNIGAHATEFLLWITADYIYLFIINTHICTI